MKPRGLRLEPLEDRIAPSLTLEGMPAWVQEGPSPEIGNGNTFGIPAHDGSSPASGAIDAIVSDPHNPNIIYVGAVNGGVWKTENARDTDAGGHPTPHWTPLTDQFGSLSIGALAVSPIDSQILFAGLAGSSSALIRGPSTGLLRTVRTGTGDMVWTQVGRSAFPDLTLADGSPLIGDNFNVTQVLPLNIGTGAADEVVLLSAWNTSLAHAGLFLSRTGGATWQLVSDGVQLPTGDVTDMVADPLDPTRFYVAIAYHGIYQGIYSTNNGTVTWTQVTAGITDTPLDQAGIKLAVDSNATLYASVGMLAVPPALGFPVLQVNQFYRATDPTLGWSPLAGLLPNVVFGVSSQAGHFVADPANPGVLYIGGGGRVTQGDANLAPVVRGRVSGGQIDWELLTDVGSSPHTDGRDLQMDLEGNVLFSSDGGVYRLENPNNDPPTRKWESLAGDLAAFEFYDVDYDPTKNVIVGGAQDNGVPYQSAPGSPVWTDLQGGDGGAIFSVGTAGGDYFALADQMFLDGSKPGGIAWYHVSTDPNTPPIRADLKLIDSDTGHVFLVSEVKGMPFAVNRLENRLIVNLPLNNSNYLYESDLFVLDPAAIVDNTLTIYVHNRGQLTDPVNSYYNGNGKAPMVYGGKLNGAAMPDVLWVGAGTHVLLRSGGAGMPQPTSYAGGEVRAIAVDSEDYRRAAVVDLNGKVWYTENGGDSFFEVTGNLAKATGSTNGVAALQLQTIELVSNGSDVAMLVGGYDGVYRIVNPDLTHPALQTWTEFGSGLPNALVTSLQYDPANDVLLAGTLGRGAWTIRGAGANFDLWNSALLSVVGDADFANENDDIVIRRNAYNPLLLDVVVNGQSQLDQSPLPLASVSAIIVAAGGGQDTLTVDFSNGVFTPPDHIFFSGGADDTLHVVGTSSADSVSVTEGMPAGITMVTMDGSSLRLFRNVGSLEIDTGGGSDAINVESIPAGTTATINAGEGNDIFQISPQAQNLDAIAGALILNGGAGDHDSLTVNDQDKSLTADPEGFPNWVITDSAVARQGSDTISYAAFEDLTVNAGNGQNVAVISTPTTPLTFNNGNGDSCFALFAAAPVVINDGSGNSSVDIYANSATAQINASSGNDRIAVWNTAAGSETTINGGAGDDTIDVGVGNLSDLRGHVTVHGQTGSNDGMFLNDQNASVDDPYAITASTVARGLAPGFGGVSYDTIESLTVDAARGNNAFNVYSTAPNVNYVLNGDSGSDTFSILATAAGSSVTVNGGDDNDTVNIGNVANSLDDILGPLNVHGDRGGHDALNLNDQGTSRRRDLDITANSISRAGAATISFATVENFVINASNGGNLITVDSTPASTSMALNAGQGSDTVFMGNVALLLATLSIDGGGGIDTLDYSANTIGVIVDLAVGSASGAPGGIRNIRNVTGGQGNDLLRGDALDNVLSGLGGNDILVGGAGNDVLRGGAGRDLLIGGLGTDLLEGGDDEDILVGGSTVYDTNQSALLGLLAEWTRTDLTYDHRVNDLRQGGGLNGAFVLNKNTVLDDGVMDILTGGAGQDWFSIGNKDTITDLSPDERVR